MTVWASPQRKPNLSFQQHSKVQGTQKTLKIGARNRFKINKNPRQDPQGLLSCAPKCSWIVPGPPRMPKWRQGLPKENKIGSRNRQLKAISLIRQGYSLTRRANALIRQEYARGRLTQISPRSQQSHAKSCKVVQRSPKHIKIGPKIQQNSNICEELVFATPFTPNPCF